MNERPRLALAAVFVATLLLFAPVLGFGWMPLDDYSFVVDNPNVNQGLGLDGLRWSLTTSHGGNWMPLSWLSHMLDVSLFGMWPGGHHATSALLHALNGVLLFLWLHAATGAFGRSLAAAAIFAVHPLHVESVAWIAERKDVLSTFFGFASIWAYVEHAKRGGRWRMGACAALMAASLASKPTLVTLPFALLLLDVWPLARIDLETPIDWRGWRTRVVEKLPLFALAALVSGVTLWAQASQGAMGWAQSLGWTERLANALQAIGTYLVQSIWPVRLGAYYPHPYLIPEVGPTPSGAWLFGLALCLLAATLNAWRARGYLLVGWLWFLGTLVPMLGIVQVGSQAHADRYLYVPLIGLIIAVCWWVPDALARRMLLTSEGRRESIATGIAIASVGALAALTLPQLATWRDGESMLRQTLVASPRNPQMRYMLAAELWARGNREEALAQLRRALQVWPGFPEAHHRLGQMLEAQGEREAAIAHYREALRLAPGQPVVEQALAAALRAGAAPARSLEELRAATLAAPNDAEAGERYAAALSAADRPAEAAAELGRVLSQHPERTKLHCSRGLALRRAGDENAAADAYAHCLRDHPDHVTALTELGTLLARRGAFAEAAVLLERALELDTANGTARANLDELEALRRRAPRPGASRREAQPGS